MRASAPLTAAGAVANGLNGELFRARRLVVDLGIHAQKWTREQAIAYKIRQSDSAVAAGAVGGGMEGPLKFNRP
jgi:hypothetical protein